MNKAGEKQMFLYGEDFPKMAHEAHTLVRDQFAHFRKFLSNFHDIQACLPLATVAAVELLQARVNEQLSWDADFIEFGVTLPTPLSEVPEKPSQTQPAAPVAATTPPQVPCPVCGPSLTQVPQWQPAAPTPQKDCAEPTPGPTVAAADATPHVS
eukprot:TRINITY_DN1642_c0_g1_i6.p2 TRINITY_DN1642_c0_g1~~TRINITY_DN1642_c0_g1_i6.p2  ORF type:complete len:154 (-),score=40.40 TRINITY_DN1642_c0_g1_i6:55-516(-)